jgi:inorganic pyrophosphatase
VTRIKVELEGDMAEQAVTAVLDRLEELDKAIKKITDISNMNADSLDIIEASIEDLKKAQNKLAEMGGL